MSLNYGPSSCLGLRWGMPLKQPAVNENGEAWSD